MKNLLLGVGYTRMAFKQLDILPIAEKNPGKHWIMPTRLGSGWSAVHWWINNEEPDMGPFPEPWQTGIGRYKTREEACIEVKQWAEAEEMDYYL